jgi:hypothetical protein
MSVLSDLLVKTFLHSQDPKRTLVALICCHAQHAFHLIDWQPSAEGRQGLLGLWERSA